LSIVMTIIIMLGVIQAKSRDISRSTIFERIRLD